MDFPRVCNFCKKAPIVDLKHEGLKTKVKYECGSNSVHDNSGQFTVNTLNNRCTFVPPEGISANPDDWTDFYKTEIYEQGAYDAHLEMMEDRFQWLHELGDAYKTLVKDLSKKKPMDQEVLLLLQTCLTCRTELITAFRALARGYSTDCRLKTRLAVEYAIFAARAVEKPDTAAIWLAAGNSETDWKHYRDSFKIYYLLEKDEAWKVLAELKPQLKRLADDYAHLSQFTHATVISSGIHSNGSQLVFKGSFVERFSKTQFLSKFAELVDTHLNVIDLMVKLSEFLKIEIDSGIFELVELLEEDLDRLNIEIDEITESQNSEAL